MAAVVRVKRRIDEEPLNAFILNCKRPKIENESVVTAVRENLLESKDEVSTILKFAGTVKSQDENIGSQITKLSKDEAKQLALKSRKPNIIEKNRREMRQTMQDNRFKVVNCFRTIQNDDDNDESIPKEITVVDIEKQSVTATATATTSDFETNSQSFNEQLQQSTSSQASNIQQNLNDYFVYDLYLPEANDQQNMNIDYNDPTYISIRPFDDLVYEDRCNDENDDLSINESEDSNAENHWRNDYPDEDSISDSDMLRAMNNGEDGENELSSDEDYYEGYVHSINIEEGDYEDDMDYCDADRYGSAYAKYKARILRKNKNDQDDKSDNSDHSDDDSD